MINTNNKQATILALIAILFWSTVATAFKLALLEIHYAQLLFYASLTSFIALIPIFIFSRKHKTNKKIILSKKNVLNSAILGSLNPFLYYLILFKAYDLLPAQEAMVLNYAWPIVLVVLSAIILKQKIKPLSYIAILICFFGVFVIASKGNIFGLNFNNPLGTGLAIGSSLIWALFWIFNIKNTRNEIEKLFFNFFFGTLFCFIYLFISKTSLIISQKAIIPIIYIGLFEMSITFTLWLTALKKTDTTDKISKLVFLSPFLSLIFIAIILKENILISTFIGLILIVIGIVLQQIIPKKIIKNNK